MFFYWCIFVLHMSCVALSAAILATNTSFLTRMVMRRDTILFLSNTHPSSHMYSFMCVSLRQSQWYSFIHCSYWLVIQLGYFLTSIDLPQYHQAIWKQNSMLHTIIHSFLIDEHQNLKTDENPNPLYNDLQKTRNITPSNQLAIQTVAVIFYFIHYNTMGFQ